MKNKFLSSTQKNIMKIIQRTQIRSRIECHLEVKKVWEQAREGFYRNKLLIMMKKKPFSRLHTGYVLFSLPFM